MTLLRANALHVPLADNSVHCCVTSPPYFQLRDYGIDGQLGLEATPDAYVANMVAVFREVRRVLRPDATLWLNIGDSYFGGIPGQGGPSDKQLSNHGSRFVGATRPVACGLKPKDLVGIPWRVAFALQADGWWLRSEITWAKKAPMPESVTDRPTSATEKVFLLAKAARYFYDAEAVREELSPTASYGGTYRTQTKIDASRHDNGYINAIGKTIIPNPSGRNMRNWWLLGPGNYPEAHFATYPPALVEPCILAGTSARGVCPQCGAPWKRVVERESILDPRPMTTGATKKTVLGEMARTTPQGRTCGTVEVTTTGWQPTCTCDAGEPVPATVLDPFIGSGTTGAVATNLGRRFVGLDLSAEYLRLAQRRVAAANTPLIPVGL